MSALRAGWGVCTIFSPGSFGWFLPVELPSWAFCSLHLEVIIHQRPPYLRTGCGRDFLANCYTYLHEFMIHLLNHQKNSPVSLFSLSHSQLALLPAPSTLLPTSVRLNMLWTQTTMLFTLLQNPACPQTYLLSSSTLGATNPPRPPASDSTPFTTAPLEKIKQLQQKDSNRVMWHGKLPKVA